MYDIDKAMTEMKEASAVITRLSTEVVEHLFDGFFDQFPEVKTIYWTQYCPSFNDGSPCQFSVNEVGFSPARWETVGRDGYDEELDEVVLDVQGEDEDRDKQFWDFGESEFYFHNKASPELLAKMDKLRVIMQSSKMAEAMNVKYGYAFVRVHNDGQEIEEYYE